MQVTNPCRTHWQRKWLELDVTSLKVQELADAAESWACGLLKQKGPALLVLAGVPGCGKTHTAKALYGFTRSVSFQVFETNHLRRPLTCLYREWPSIADGFKDYEFGVLEDLFNADVLFLDDIGAETDTQGKLATDKLCQVLSRREGRFTVLTTNIAPDYWATRFDVRVYDRLFRGSRIVDLFAAESYAMTTFQ